MKLTPRLALAVVSAGLLVSAPFTLSPFYVNLLNFIGIYTLVALGLVLLTGVAGQTSFGQAAFMGVGGYATAILTTRAGADPWLALAIGLACTAPAAYLIGFVTLRLKGHFLPLATIGWQTAIYVVYINWRPFTGGNDGISGVPPMSIASLELRDDRIYFYLIWTISILALLGVQNLTRSRVGRAIRTFRTAEVMGESFGVNTASVKIQVFVLAAMLASLAGSLYVHLLRFANPTPFSLEASIRFLAMAVVGGASQVWGAVLGAGLITGLDRWLQDLLPQVLGRTGNFEAIVFGLLLILILHRSAGGLWPLIERLLGRAEQALRIDARQAPFDRRDPPAAAETLLEVHSASKAFGGLLAVNGLSFAVRQGEILGLIGPNGAGKTTMFNLITGVALPTSGKVFFRGRGITGMAPHAVIHEGVARTFQQPRTIAAMTVLDNVLLGLYHRTRSGIAAGLLRLDRKEEARARAEALRALERVGLARLADRSAGELPLGQQRLLEIARALAADPVLLLLDEPAAGLRSNEKGDLAALLRTLRDEGVTILLVEHDMDLVMNLADRLVVMHYGEKLAEGSPAEVRRDPSVIEAYLGVPSAA